MVNNEHQSVGRTCETLLEAIPDTCRTSLVTQTEAQSHLLALSLAHRRPLSKEDGYLSEQYPLVVRSSATTTNATVQASSIYALSSSNKSLDS